MHGRIDTFSGPVIERLPWGFEGVYVDTFGSLVTVFWIVKTSPLFRE